MLARMSKRYFAKQHATDANEPEIVEALEAIGCKCYSIEKPVDLLVEYQRIWVLLEVKNPLGRNTMQVEQLKFFDIARAPAYVVRSGLEAVAAVRDASLQALGRNPSNRPGSDRI